MLCLFLCLTKLDLGENVFNFIGEPYLLYRVLNLLSVFSMKNL